MDLPSLLPVRRAHAIAPTACPWSATFGDAAHVESQRRPDVPPPHCRHEAEDHDVTNREKGAIVILRLLRNWIRLARPRKDVTAPDQEREKQQEEGDWQKSDIALHKANHRAGPSRCRNAL